MKLIHQLAVSAGFPPLIRRLSMKRNLSLVAALVVVGSVVAVVANAPTANAQIINPGCDPGEVCFR